jgi:hypothetical protein
VVVPGPVMASCTFKFTSLAPSRLIVTLRLCPTGRRADVGSKERVQWLARMGSLFMNRCNPTGSTHVPEARRSRLVSCCCGHLSQDRCCTKVLLDHATSNINTGCVRLTLFHHVSPMLRMCPACHCAFQADYILLVLKQLLRQAQHGTRFRATNLLPPSIPLRTHLPLGSQNL